MKRTDLPNQKPLQFPSMLVVEENDWLNIEKVLWPDNIEEILIGALQNYYREKFQNSNNMSDLEYRLLATANNENNNIAAMYVNDLFNVFEQNATASEIIEQRHYVANAADIQVYEDLGNGYIEPSYNIDTEDD